MGGQTAVRGLDPALWRELRAVAVRSGMPVGELLNDIIRAFLADNGYIPPDPA